MNLLIKTSSFELFLLVSLEYTENSGDNKVNKEFFLLLFSSKNDISNLNFSPFIKKVKKI